MHKARSSEKKTAIASSFLPHYSALPFGIRLFAKKEEKRESFNSAKLVIIVDSIASLGLPTLSDGNAFGRNIIFAGRGQSLHIHYRIILSRFAAKSFIRRSTCGSNQYSFDARQYVSLGADCHETAACFVNNNLLQSLNLR